MSRDQVHRQSRLRLCVIGAGSWVVASHLPNLARRRDNVEFTGVCRIGAEALTQLQEQWGFAKASEDYQDILALEPDIVVVGSPAAQHYEHALAALEAGAHVLVEKPFTLTAAQARGLVGAADRLDRHLVVSLGYNYRPIVTGTREHLARIGGLGQIEFAAVEMSSVTRELLAGTGGYPLADPLFRPDTSTWADHAVSGGGYGQAQLPHALGVLLWLTSLRGESAFARMSSALGATVEHYVAGAVRFEGGALGTVTGSAAHTAANLRDYLSVTVVGSAGELRMEFHNDLVRTYTSGRGVEEVPMPPEAGRYDCDGPPDALIDLALGRIEACTSPGELGLRTVEVTEALYASARAGAAAAVQHEGDPGPPAIAHPATGPGVDVARGPGPRTAPGTRLWAATGPP